MLDLGRFHRSDNFQGKEFDGNSNDSLCVPQKCMTGTTGDNVGDSSETLMQSMLGGLRQQT